MKLKRECRPIQSTDVKVNSCRCPKAQAAKVHLCSSVQNLSRVPVQTTTLEANKTPKGETERKRGQRREAASGRRGIHKPLKRKRGGGVGPVIEERPTQRGGDRHQNNKHTMVERAEPHAGHKTFSAMEHKEERSKPASNRL